MKIFPNKYPFNIPYLLAGFVGSAFGIFALTALVAETVIGRPSSTHAIGFLYVPAYATLVALIFFCIGFAVRLVISKFVTPRSISRLSNRIINILFVCSLALSFFSGVVFIERQEEKQKPHVIYDSGRIIKISPSAIKGKKDSEAKFVFTIYSDEKNKVESFLWNGKKIHFNVIGDNTLKILDKGRHDLVTADLNKYDYIGRIYVQRLAIGDSASKGLSVLVRLRATSRRSMLLIYDSAAKLVYQELLKRDKGDSITHLLQLRPKKARSQE